MPLKKCEKIHGVRRHPIADRHAARKKNRRDSRTSTASPAANTGQIIDFSLEFLHHLL
jgi:hypothetical protein